MDFFNSLTQVAKNNKNLKKWEEQQADTQAQREELYKRRKYSDAEIEHARQSLATELLTLLTLWTTTRKMLLKT